MLTAIRISRQNPVPQTSIPLAKKMSKQDLSEYNDSGKHQQILLAYEGSVYDVTQGKEFYGTGGPYHFLAGTDATAMLHIAGGSIVQKKYPIIAILSQ